MSYIILDMEWNQPYDASSPLAIRLCTTLPFEIIQIGAVNLETGARFKRTCCLQQYRTLSKRISKLTGITKNDIENGVPFKTAFLDFLDFCGPDPLLMTWGFNDIPILRQNLSFYGMDTSLTEHYCNLQIPFHQQFDPDGDMRGLSYAVNFFGLAADERYHDGLNDAAYTAEIARRLDLERARREYPEYLLHFDGDGDQAFLDCLRYANYNRFESFEDMTSDPRISATPCPVCDAETLSDVPVFPDSGKMFWVCRCREHGGYLVRVSFRQNRDTSLHASKVVFPLDGPHKAMYDKAAAKAARPKRRSFASFRLFLDADGCPVVAESVRIAQKRKVRCFLVCDTSHTFPDYAGTEQITVDKGDDSADFKIVEQISPGDIVVTQDYGLAAMCLARNARVLDQDGNRYTEGNIDLLLAQRAASARFRRAGGRTKGPSARSGKQTAAFIDALNSVIQEAYEEGKSRDPA